MSETIEVWARVRPVPKISPHYKIHRDFEESVIEFSLPRDDNKGYVNNSKLHHSFKFNGVMDYPTTQDEVFERTGKQCVDSALEGYNSTLFTYGQTGSGKTWTMTGDDEHYEYRGIIPRAIEYLFEEVSKRSAEYTFAVYVSYLEIYNNAGHDLLFENARKHEDLPRVSIQEDSQGNIHLKHLSQVLCRSEEDAVNQLFIGDTNRTVCETPMNELSSRSHCIFTLNIESRPIGHAEKIRYSKLHFVDLAGSERIGKTGVEGTIQLEARSINVSLHFLQQVIVALSEGHDFVPYRNSLMTTVLRDSLGGNCRTIMIATINPSEEHLGESISTCRFAQSVACVKQNAVLNEKLDPSVVIARLKKEVVELKEELNMLKGGQSRTGPLDAEELSLVRDKVNEYVADTSPLATLALGGDMLRIREAFRLLKDMVIDARKHQSDRSKTIGRDDSTESGSLSSRKRRSSEADAMKATTKNETGEYSAEVQEKLKNLATAVQLRDVEIDILVSMLNKQQKVDNSTQTDDDDSNDTHTFTSRRTEPSPRVTNSVDKEQLKAIAQQRYQQQQQQQMLRQSLSSEETKQPMTVNNDNISEYADVEILKDRALAMEVFRKSYRKFEVLESTAQRLSDKSKEAKDIAAKFQQSKSTIAQLKSYLTQLRVEKAMQGLVNKNQPASEEDGVQSVADSQFDPEEQQIRDQLDREREKGHQYLESLKTLRKEVQHMQHAFDSGRQKLIQDFETWYTQIQKRVRKNSKQQSLDIDSGLSRISTEDDSSSTTTTTVHSSALLSSTANSVNSQKPPINSSSSSASTSTSYSANSARALSANSSSDLGALGIGSSSSSSGTGDNRNNGRAHSADSFQPQLTGDKEADEDIIALYKIRQNLLMKRAASQE